MKTNILPWREMTTEEKQDFLTNTFGGFIGLGMDSAAVCCFMENKGFKWSFHTQTNLEQQISYTFKFVRHKDTAVERVGLASSSSRDEAAYLAALSALGYDIRQ